MKLYELQRGQRFTLAGDETKTKYELDHIDGMYSLCYSCFGRDTFNFGATTDVVPQNTYNETTLA